MADVHDPTTRSFNMSCIRSRGNKTTELKLRQVLREAGITGWRRSYRLFGSPDFVFRQKRVAVFVDGCFWHGCARGCKPLPLDNPFWSEKIMQNRRRDRAVMRTLRGNGWRVIRIWEHELAGDCRKTISRIRRMLDVTVPS
jgi:DNA mismatch endonuclease (patch repair protein)